MGQFRKKPVVIEAVKWDAKNGIAGGAPDWIKNAMDDFTVLRFGNEIQIRTLEGVMIASDGDWIIKGVEGEIYPCKPEIFAKSYEPTS